jgi:hypothetical protein
MKVIINDPEVQICRVKNRMDPGYNASATAGYRDVVLNMQIKTQQTAAMGVDGHVCEVQLILNRFAELKVWSFLFGWIFPAGTLNSACAHSMNLLCCTINP